MTIDLLARRLTITLILVMAVLLQSLPYSTAQAGEINVDSDDIAIKGYDSVAYFTMDEAVRGSEEITYAWLGAKWFFAKEEHRDAFAADPVKYAPQYGGYCAVGVSFGRRVPGIDPEAWRFVDGKLYLNYDPNMQGDPHEMVARANANWDKHKKYFTGE